MQLLITNPPKTKRTKRKARNQRKARRRSVRALQKKEAPTMAKKRRRRSSRSRRAFSAVPARRTSRRRGFARFADGFSIAGALKQGAAAGAGAIAAVGLLGMLNNSIPDALKASPMTRAMTKAAVGIGLGFVAKKVGQGKYATAIAAGAIATSLIDVYQDWKSRQPAASGVRGLNYFGANTGIGELPAFDANGNPIQWAYAAEQA